MEGGGEEKRREIQDRRNKLRFSGWRKHFTPAWNQQPRRIESHTCSSLFGHWVVLFSLGETPETPSALPAALVPSVCCDTDEPAEFMFRSRRSSRRSISTESDGSAPKHFVETFLPALQQVLRPAGGDKQEEHGTGLILIHLCCSQSNVTQSSRHRQQWVRLFCLGAQPNIWSSSLSLVLQVFSSKHQVN